MGIWLTPFIVLFAVAFATSLILTPVARRVAWYLDAVDYPNARRINVVATPRMGGIAIFCALVTAAAFMRYLGPRLGWPVILVRQLAADLDYRLIAAGFTLIFLTGAVDDVTSLTPLIKLCGQIFAAMIACSGGLVIGNIVNPLTSGEIMLGWLAYPITVVYLVSYANIINLIDGLDGLAAGTSVIAGFTMFVLGFMSGHLDAAALAVAIVGGSLGFLPYNFNPASIFLGDSGSLLLGFSLGTMSLLNVTRFAGLTTIIVPLVVAGIPIIDTFSAIVRRCRAHVSIGHADRGHIHHRLIAEGYDQRQAVLLIYGWTALLCAGAIVMTQVELWPRMAIFVILFSSSALFTMHLHLFEPVLRHHYDVKTHRDILITPDDPAFALEEEREILEAEARQEEREERLHHRKNPPHSGTGSETD